MFEYFLLVLGIIFLIKGADFLVKGSSSLAHRLKISSLVIGLTIVSIGTTMPELFVSIIGSIENAPNIVFGNAIGSNISNILLILGITAIISNLRIHRITIWKEMPFSFLGIILLALFANKSLLNFSQNHFITRTDGIILLFFFGAFLYHILDTISKEKKSFKKSIDFKTQPYLIISLLLLVGIVLLYVGGKITVENAILVARNLGLSNFLISATIIAVGTSLPELATAITAALKKDPDMAIGNIIGANILNIFWVLGLTAAISPILIPSFINLDLIILGAVTLLLFVFMFTGKKSQLTRTEGIIMVAAYIAYIIFLLIRG
ncbi:MAG: calcium/sodium antiporter [Nanoarchaeota archaeon]|nr:calcium/sodium antiporter [Nanoarchaeota archaeon]